VFAYTLEDFKRLATDRNIRQSVVIRGYLSSRRT